MNTSEKFLRFAAECEFMAQFTHNPKNKTVWSDMAERWLRCAELFDRQSSSARNRVILQSDIKNPLAPGLTNVWPNGDQK